MYLFTSRAIRAALLPLAIGILVASANAQQARFTLPFETHWSNAVLPAGEYTMSMTDDLSWPKILTVSGHGKTVYILASIEALAPESEGSYLTIVDAGDTRVVREFNSGLTGRSFTFELPKAMRAQIAFSGHSTEVTKIAARIRN